ncbi:CPBP family intramembrane glutamic endopeptidase [Dyella subtropica]|uniref:CPBP family intramembrane glutamic endopeptidase n=1 Tax=Dyella subtropica TaxID=2992127 RepID=UPI002259D9FB|nr:CPBP family intramembrane glutamic endopeptidase [Dyella subtropica]
MQTEQIAFITPTTAPAWQRWLVFSPVARIATFVAMMIILSVAAHTTVGWLGWAAKSASPLHQALAKLSMQLLPVVLAYLALVKLVERRRITELSPRTLPALGVLGLVIGAGLISFVIGVLWLAGSYHVVGTNPGVDWLPAVLVVGVGASIGEEIITRGVLFRIIEEGLGTWWALAISAVFFGAAHIFNPGATLWSSAAIAIEAGILLALLYHVTRSLWACIGMHAAWNILQGTLYGVAVSGTHADGLLVSTLTGPDWLSGGAFGAEASVVALLTCSTASAVLLVITLRRDSIVPPAWRRKAKAATS